MKCEKARQDMAAWIDGTLDADARGELEEHLAGCDDCREEAAAMRTVIEKLGAIPAEEPSPAMRANFYSMLAAYKQGLAHAVTPIPWRRRIIDGLDRFLPKQPVTQLAFAAVILIVGLYAGRHSVPAITPVQESTNEVAELRGEVKEMRETMSMALLNQSSAVERIQGVSMTRTISQPDNQLLERLIGMLNNDPSVDVRLAAVDALYLFSGQSWVRDALVSSLSQQESPLVQVALIDLMVEIREQKALDALRTLIGRQDENQKVKDRARWGIDQIS